MGKNTPVTNRVTQTQTPDWLYQEFEEDDFLMGKTPSPSETRDLWEEEE